MPTQVISNAKLWVGKSDLSGDINALAMRYGADVIEIAPGACAHLARDMRHSEASGDLVRVLLTFRTPADHRFTIRMHSLLEGTH